MNLTCAQMDVLISFYIEGDLSKTLKKQVETHLENCPTCRAKFDIIQSMIMEMNSVFEPEEKQSQQLSLTEQPISQHYKLFKSNLSAYIDNELSNDESIKIKKFVINNPQARKELEDSYQIRKLLNNSFKKNKNETKQDFSKTILRQLEIDEETALEGIHPVIKIILAFTISVLVLTAIILMSLSV